MYKNILKKIKENNKICIFRHIDPDGDAVFSSLGLATWIKENFKDKQVKICGFQTYDIHPHIEVVSDKFIKESLAIVLDTSNATRADDQRFLQAPYIIKIDHHPNLDPYGNENYVEIERSSTSEIIADILYSFKLTMTTKACEYLYCGILTDSLNFKTNNTTYKTLELAGKLAHDGKLDVANLSEKVFNDPLDVFQKNSKLRSYLKVNGSLGTIVLDQKDLNKIGYSREEVTKQISEFGSIKELKIWLIAAYNKKTKLYDGSFRSRGKYQVNKYCQIFNGGGHYNAAGCRDLTKDQLNALIDMLLKESQKKK